MATCVVMKNPLLAMGWWEEILGTDHTYFVRGNGISLFITETKVTIQTKRKKVESTLKEKP